MTQQDELLLALEEIHNMEQLIVVAMTNEGEYPVEDVGEHATTIARILIFNGYRQLTKARPIIEKQERERLGRIYYSCVNNNPISRIVELEQALKEGK